MEGIFLELMGSRGIFDFLMTHGKENLVYCQYSNLPVHLYRLISLSFSLFMPRQKKVAGYYVIPSNILSVQSMTRLCAEINNGNLTYIFCGIIPLCNFQYRNGVRSITLIPFKIISQNLVEI